MVVPRVLVTLPQLPHDPASGGARTMATIAEFLSASGFRVRGLATTMSEGESAVDVARVLDAAESVLITNDNPEGTPIIRFRRRGVDYVLQDVNDCPPLAWRQRHGRQYDQLFDEELIAFGPDILLSFGADDHDVARRRRARAAGARVVFGLFHTGYLDSGLGPYVDSVVTPSRFITTRYRQRWGIDSTPLPTPVQLDEVLCPDRVPTRVTVVNPSVGKGAMLLARLAHTLETDFPDIPMEVIESRSSGRLLIQAGFAGGFDLRRHPNLLFRPTVTMPYEIYRNTRVLLVPSVAEEASARVVAEAMLNGIPVIVSDVGGLPENCAGGGYVIPLPPTLTTNTRRPTNSESVRPWIEVLAAMFADDTTYEEASARARTASERFSPRSVIPQYHDYFSGVLKSGPSAEQPERPKAQSTPLKGPYRRGPERSSQSID